VDVILVVEDDPQVARLIALVLQRNGYTSRVVADGQSGLQQAKELLPDIIFADLTIKGMGGDVLCTLLKAHPDTKEIPYIVVSGDRDIADKARQCGADDYMSKPFEFDDLIRLVKKYARTESRKAD
jgi:Response regulators consisting of a CheY-like receiver domain and a winged-helix DNA-binding domain